MNEALAVLERWQLTLAQARQQTYPAPTPGERERRHALWLLALGWPVSQAAQALKRDAHTIGAWLAAFRETGPASFKLNQTGGSLPPRAGPNRHS